MKRIESHRYNTPTADNRDCSYSVGVLNLTKDEAEMIERLASQMNGERAFAVPQPSNAERVTYRRPPPKFTCNKGHPLETETSWCMQCARRMSAPELEEEINRRQKSVMDPVDKPKDEAPVIGNRFSGLDIG